MTAKDKNHRISLTCGDIQRKQQINKQNKNNKQLIDTEKSKAVAKGVGGDREGKKGRIYGARRLNFG